VLSWYGQHLFALFIFGCFHLLPNGNYTSSHHVPPQRT
jgi:hypothetical protein